MANVSYFRGVNNSSAEFTHDADHLPGTYGTDYLYPSQSDIAYVASRGHKIQRVPFRWERIQPVLGGPLNAAELQRLKDVVAQGYAAGMLTIIDVHNYAEFINSTANGGATLRLGSDLATAHLNDLWTRLSTAFKGNPGIYAYDLMNEPHDLAPTPGTFTGTTRYDWSDSTLQGWTGDAATATNVAGKLNLASTATAGFFQFRKDDGGLKRGGVLAGNVLSAVITLGAGVAGSWVAKVQWQNASYQWRTAPSITYQRVDTGAPVNGLIAGVAVRVVSDFTSSPITSPNAFAVQVESNNATAGAVSASVDDFMQGSLAGALSGPQVWEQISQSAVAAIRANADNTTIMVPGTGYSAAQYWTVNHPAPWITDPAKKIIYQAHYYPDTNHAGQVFDFDADTADAVSKGFPNLSSKAVSELKVFTDWCFANSVKGFIGEVGWPKSDSRWSPVGEAMYAHLDSVGMDATYWSTGPLWGSVYALNPYDNVQTPTAIAAVIENHPSVLPSSQGANMSLVSQVSTAFTRVGTEFKTLRNEIAAKFGSATLTTTDKTVFGAINEINAKPSGTGGAAIADGAPSGTTVYSSSKVTADIAAAKASIINGAPAAFDTLAELATQMATDETAATALATAVGNRVRYDIASSMTATQQGYVQAAIGVPSTTLIGDTTTDFSGQFVTALA